MKKNLYLTMLMLILLVFTQAAYAGNTGKKAAAIIQGNIACRAAATDIPTGSLTSDKTITLGRSELLFLDANTDVFGKGYTFIMRGSYNGWDYDGDENEKKISAKDILVAEENGKLSISTNSVIDAAKSGNNTAAWDDIVSLYIFDKDGNYIGYVFQNIPLNLLNAGKFTPIANATITAVSTKAVAKSDAAGNYQLNACKDRTALKVSANGFVDKIVYVNISGSKPLLKDIILEKSSFNLGSRYRYYDFYSEELANSRKVIVYLPSSYQKDTKRRYPVLYMHDGQNLFVGNNGDGSRKWRVDETIDKLVSEGKIKEVIVVGMYCTKHREAEYADYMRSQYADFVVKDVKPIIDGRFRTLTGRENTAIMGSSYGALISLYTAYKYPQVFGMIGSVSTATYNGDIFDTIQNGKNKHFDRIWVDTGTAEDEDGVYVTSARRLKSLFEEQGYKAEKNLGYYEAEGANHNEESWSERLWRPLTFFFGK